ncbi:unnamed protein product [Orchesella dallaii]|uniref:Uncharacterized protein n=1 Tax=Orchesella dallaii TaxID=48710 RepID=A0ABP1RPA7_9HEXA
MPNPRGAMGERDDQEAFKRNMNNLWRCMVVCGGVEAMPESCRKVVANEMAVHGFLRKLRQDFPDFEVPRYEPPSEFLICPKVRPPMGKTPILKPPARYGYFLLKKSCFTPDTLWEDGAIISLQSTMFHGRWNRNSTTVNKYWRENIRDSCC